MTEPRQPRNPPSPDRSARTQGTATSTPAGETTVGSTSARTWGGLQIIDEIGRGAFGCVYRAWDDALAREVALKVIQLPHSDPALSTAVLREGRMLARVRHRNVVAVYGAQQIEDEIGLWMELIKGRDLSRIIRVDGAMGPEEATVIGISLCHALAAVHSAGLLHRDIKAHNVMRESGGRIVLMDFGAGRDLSDLTQTGGPEMTGTPLYMAPEVLAGRPASASSDIYSLGVLLYFLVTHEYPIEGRTVTDVVMAHGLGRRKLLSDLRPDLPDAFVGVVERALSPTPERRFKTAGTMMRELAEAAPGMSESWRGRMAAALEPAESTGPARPGPDAALEAGTRVQRPAQPRLPPRVEAEPASPAAARLIWWTAAAIAAVLAVGFLGLATTAAFDMTLGREAFTDSSVAVWLLYGVRTLVPMMVYAGLTLVFARVVQFAWRLLRNIIPPLQRFHDRVSATLAGLTLRLGLQETATAAQGFFLLQVFSVFVLWWAFADLIAALVMLVNDDPEVSYAPLAPDNQSRFAFRPILTAVLVGMVAGWRSLLTKPVRGRAIDWGAKAGGFALIGVVLLMAAVPYRLLSYSAFPRVDFNGQRCYQTGTSGKQVLLFCPDTPPPRNRIVLAEDPAIEPTGVIESVFSPPSGSHQ